MDASDLKQFEHYLLALHAHKFIAIRVFQALTKENLHDDWENFIPGLYMAGFSQPLENKTQRKNLFNTFSEIRKYAKDFLSHRFLQENRWQAKAFWIQFADAQQWQDERDAAADEFFSEISHATPKSHLEFPPYALAAFYQYLNYSESDKKIDFLSIQQLSNLLTSIYTILHLKLKIEMLNYKRVENIQTPGFNHPAPPVLQVLQSTLELLENKDSFDFEKHHQHLRQTAGELEANFLHNIIRIWKNHLIRKQRRDKFDSQMHAIHQINKFAADNGFFLKSGRISPAEFIGVVNAATKSKDKTWSLHFIKQSQTLLPPEYLEETLALSNAVINYEEGKYPDAYAILMRINPEEISNLLRRRIELLRCKYEMGESPDEIKADIKNFKELLLRKHFINKETLSGLLNFLEILNFLTGRSKSKAIISEKLNSYEIIILYPWLRDKLAAYKQRK